MPVLKQQNELKPQRLWAHFCSRRAVCPQEHSSSDLRAPCGNVSVDVSPGHPLLPFPYRCTSFSLLPQSSLWFPFLCSVCEKPQSSASLSGKGFTVSNCLSKCRLLNLIMKQATLAYPISKDLGQHLDPNPGWERWHEPIKLHQGVPSNSAAGECTLGARTMLKTQHRLLIFGQRISKHQL